MFLRGWLVESLPGGRGTLGHVFWPVAHVVILVEDQARRTRLVMLGAALTHIVHAAVLFVPEEGDMCVLILANNLVRVDSVLCGAPTGCFKRSFIHLFFLLLVERSILISFIQTPCHFV